VADSSSSGLPPLPAITLTLLGDAPATASPFLALRRLSLTATFPDGTTSAPFTYDALERRALDAVVVAAHFERGGERHVYLRSALRPPLLLRSGGPTLPVGQWELPAGLIEPGEAPAHAAAREIEEELGFVLEPARFVPLGPAALPAPGIIGEVHYFFHVAVDPRTRTTPTEDGSPLERGAHVEAMPLPQLLAFCRAGHVHDEKTELALRRLAEL
jgi:ADP-ribose pyrophosphatase